MSGTARFECFEGTLDFGISMQHTGTSSIAGKLVAGGSPRCSILFEIDSDQTYLTTLFADLEQALLAYPTRQ